MSSCLFPSPSLALRRVTDTQWGLRGAAPFSTCSEHRTWESVQQSSWVWWDVCAPGMKPSTFRLMPRGSRGPQGGAFLPFPSTRTC
jgi:hypothetical protein